jgi:hypothetical protein
MLSVATTVAATSIAAAVAEPPIGEAWAAAQERLPRGWTLDGLRCASTGLREEQRSEEWVALAVGPDGEQRQFKASEAHSALSGLAGSFESDADQVLPS